MFCANQKRFCPPVRMLGEMALENGLIDRIGGMFEVEEFLKNKIGAEVDICW